MTMRVAPVNHRWQLADLLNSRGLLGEAVEVGTHRGVLAEQLRRVWRGRLLYCIDPWGVPPGYEEQAAMLLDGAVVGDREGDLKEARRKLRQWLKDRSVALIRDVSPAAAGYFSDGSLDFVYLDGDHSQEAVTADLNAWWPRVKSGGILAGHDFVCPGEVAGGWGGLIQEPVLEFARDRSLDIFLVLENGPETAGQPWSFYVEKP